MTAIQALRDAPDHPNAPHDDQASAAPWDTEVAAGLQVGRNLELRGDLAGLVIGLFAMLLLVCLAYPAPG